MLLLVAHQLPLRSAGMPPLMARQPAARAATVSAPQPPSWVATLTPTASL